ncbi:carbohydrate kinase [Psychrosphaera sp. B3R10]|uniref:carbohydrate kinase family protein n=1 Tax=unclassified Psychrosphaera TaxID=2641570 RepID=UPI001C0A49D9|nr:MULTISPECIES: carbohydrate kinase [unclassified Psychrosphaera]MBU2881304.1 carbohydrate kinase [Psychrosphaera sp. I2R16]MBU2988403.1 carbohydrate kinase [Psychrosphaera sp. B3R10]MDO6720097.1 carbohydrate kinase [Psychrosphaera sp. 1_MG-2023]
MSILINHKPTNDIRVSCFGEVLWDCFDTGKRLGGAPLNMCVRINSLGIKADMISAVGNDVLGNELLSEIKDKNVSCDYIAINDNKKTSTVEVTLDSSGSASYNIVADVAWDNIELTTSLLDKVAASDVFVFGSLIGRSTTSLSTLKSLIDVANFKVFDVNLRAPHYQLDTLIELMTQADFIKLNDDELYEIAKAMGCKYHSLEQNLAFIAQQTNTNYLCVTKGSHGALLTVKGANYYNSGYLISVVDTVGAGDSFLGSLIYQLCNTDNAQYAVDFACAVGAMVAQNHGATPTLTHQQISEFMNPL